MNPGDKTPPLLAPELIEKPWSGAGAWREVGIIAEFAEATERLDRLGPAVSIFGGARTQHRHRYDQLTDEIVWQWSGAGFTTISRGCVGLMDWIRNTLVEQGMTDSLHVDVVQAIDEPAAVVDAVCERYAKRGFEPSAFERKAQPDL